MRGLQSLVVALGTLAVGCGVGSPVEGMDGTGAGGDGSGGGGGGGNAAELVGDIDQDLSLSGEIDIVGDVVIKPGAVVTATPGTTLRVASGAFVSVEGSLQIAGSADQPVVIEPADGLGFGGFKALSGASVRIAHADITRAALALKCEAGAAQCEIVDTHMAEIGQALVTQSVSSIERSVIEDMNNAGISLSEGADLLILDTVLQQSTHDIVVASGGKLTVDYSELGGAQGTYEHCNFHLGRAAEVVVTNTIIGSSIYGIMIGNTTGAVFNNNNFVDNDPGQDVLDLGGASAIDMTGNYWSQGAPTLAAGYDTSGALESPAAAGPR